MIALIEFESDLILPKEEAINIGLPYEENQRIGIRDNTISVMNSFDYYYDECKKYNDNYYKDDEAIKENNPIVDYYLYSRVENADNYVMIKKDNHLVNLFDFALKCKYKFFIKETVIEKNESVEGFALLLHKLEEKANQLESVVNKIRDNTFNQKTNVHVGGGLITTYNDLCLKEDVCTDILQQKLNNGWRIIAVCIQPNQRRPDYILGRYNPSLEVVNKLSAGR